MTARQHWLSASASCATFLLALLTLAEGVALGANGPLLALLASAGEIAVAMAVLLLLPPDWHFWRGAWPVLALLGLACLWAAVPVLAQVGSIAPDLALPGFVRLFGSCATVLAAGIVGYRRGLARKTIDWLIAAGLFQIVVGLILRSLDPDHVWGFAHSITGARFSGTMINANANAAMSSATAILAFGRAQSFLREEPASTFGRALLRVGCVLTVILAAGACMIAGSRAMMVLTITAILILLVTDPIYRAWLFRPFGMISSGAAIGATGLLFAIAGTPAIDRFVTFSQDSVGRMLVWRHYGDLALSAPRFGYGTVAFSEMNNATLRSTADAFNFWYVNSAHNQIIELVLEGGVVYAFLITLAVGWMFVPAAWQIARHRDDPVMRAALAALMLIAAAAMVDIALDVPAVVTLGAILLASLWGRLVRAKTSHDDTEAK